MVMINVMGSENGLPSVEVFFITPSIGTTVCKLTTTHTHYSLTNFDLQHFTTSDRETVLFFFFHITEPKDSIQALGNFDTPWRLFFYLFHPRFYAI